MARDQVREPPRAEANRQSSVGEYVCHARARRQNPRNPKETDRDLLTGLRSESKNLPWDKGKPRPELYTTAVVLHTFRSRRVPAYTYANVIMAHTLDERTKRTIYIFFLINISLRAVLRDQLIFIFF